MQRITPYIVKQVEPEVIDVQNNKPEFTYQIMRGDHILSIANKFNTTVEELRELNPDCAFIMGQNIKIK